MRHSQNEAYGIDGMNLSLSLRELFDDSSSPKLQIDLLDHVT